MHLCLPQHVVLQLGLQAVQQREVTTADGQRHICDYVGPAEVTFSNRSCFVGALVIGEEVLLGAVPMEDLDLVISPSRQTVEVRRPQHSQQHRQIALRLLKGENRRSMPRTYVQSTQPLGG
jgi:clan AA aspartic protease